MGKMDIDIPVILAYNQHHYDSLHPIDWGDVEKSKELIIEYLTGRYMYHMTDVACLTDKQTKTKQLNTMGHVAQILSIWGNTEPQIKKSKEKTTKTEIKQKKGDIKQQKNKKEGNIFDLLKEE